MGQIEIDEPVVIDVAQEFRVRTRRRFEYGIFRESIRKILARSAKCNSRANLGVLVIICVSLREDDKTKNTVLDNKAIIQRNSKERVC